ncbi:MAG: metallophosphoesterase [Sandaracinaceae bacterium]|nr:metallophosphoesterase [Sandaracinaceae bacterium]
MRVLHVSDLHFDVPFSAMPAGGWAFPKRWLGGANLALRRKRRFRDAADKVRELGRLCGELNVDLVICTGDYTALGTEPEILNARDAVTPITQTPLGFVTVPGNHDVYVADSVGHFERIFGDLLDPGPWPKVRIVDDTVAVVALDSARPNPQPWRSSGRIPDEQIAALPGVLESLGDRFVFVITHYAPRLADGQPDRFSHGLLNADALLAACSSMRGAILHGHVHRRYRVRIPDLTPELFCAGSSTEAGREGFWLYELGDDGSFSATQGGYEDGAYVLLAH